MFLAKLYNSFVKNLGQEAADDLLKFVDYKFEKDMEKISKLFNQRRAL